MNKKKIRGQGTIEWILIVFVLVGFVMLFGSQLKKRVVGLVDSVFEKINVSIMTGTDAH